MRVQAKLRDTNQSRSPKFQSLSQYRGRAGGFPQSVQGTIGHVMSYTKGGVAYLDMSAELFLNCEWQNRYLVALALSTPE